MNKQDDEDDVRSIVSDTTIGSDDGGLLHTLPDLSIFKNINKCVDDVIASLDVDLANADGDDSRSSPVICYTDEKLVLPTDSQETLAPLDNPDDNDAASVMSESLLEPAEPGEHTKVEEKLNESISVDDNVEEISQSLLTRVTDPKSSNVISVEASPYKAPDLPMLYLTHDMSDAASTQSGCMAGVSQSKEMSVSQIDKASSASCPVEHVAAEKGVNMQHEQKELRILEKIFQKQRFLREALLDERKPTQRQLSVMSCKAEAIQSILGDLHTAHVDEKKQICTAIKNTENEQHIRQWYTSFTRRHNQLLQLSQSQQTIHRRIKLINSEISGICRFKNVMPKEHAAVVNKRSDNRLISHQPTVTQLQEIRRMPARLPKNRLDIRNNISQNQKMQQISQQHLQTLPSVPWQNFNVQKGYASTAYAQGLSSRDISTGEVVRSSKRQYQDGRFDQVFKEELSRLKKQCQTLHTGRIGINRDISSSQPQGAYDSAQLENTNWNNTQFGREDANASYTAPTTVHMLYPTTKYFDDTRNNTAMSAANRLNVNNASHRTVTDSQCYSETQPPSIDTSSVIMSQLPTVTRQSMAQLPDCVSNQMSLQNNTQTQTPCQLPTNGAKNASLQQQMTYKLQPRLIDGLQLNTQCSKSPMYMIVKSTPKPLPGTINNLIQSRDDMTLPCSITKMNCQSASTNITVNKGLGQNPDTTLNTGQTSACKGLENNDPVAKFTDINQSSMTPCLTSTKPPVMPDADLDTDVVIVERQDIPVVDEKSRYLPLVQMIQLGVIHPGTYVLSFKHKDKVFMSSLLTDGQIQGVGGETFLGPRQWIAAISGIHIKNVKKARAYDQVMYQNQPLITYVKKYEQCPGESAVCSSQSSLPVSKIQPHPGATGDVVSCKETPSSQTTAPPSTSMLRELLADCKMKLIDDKELLKSDKFLPPDFWSLPFSSVHLSQEIRSCIDEW